MPDDAPVMTTASWLVGFERLMIASPVNSAGRSDERLASVVEIGCAAVGLIALCGGRILEHAEGPIAHPVHHRRVDGIGDGSELPEGRAGPAGPVNDRIGDHTGGLIRGQCR